MLEQSCSVKALSLFRKHVGTHRTVRRRHALDKERVKGLKLRGGRWHQFLGSGGASQQSSSSPPTRGQCFSSWRSIHGSSHGICRLASGQRTKRKATRKSGKRRRLGNPFESGFKRIADRRAGSGTKRHATESAKKFRHESRGSRALQRGVRKRRFSGCRRDIRIRNCGITASLQRVFGTRRRTHHCGNWR